MILAIALLGIGLALIVAEILFPSLGLLSVLAVACLVAGVGVAFNESTAMGLNFLIAVAVAVPIVMMLGFKLFPRSPMGKKMVAPGLSFEPEPGMTDRDRGSMGRTGVVESTLRPAGIARIDGRRVDVISRGESIEVGARVRVIEISGNRLVVAATKDDAGASGERTEETS